MRLRSLMVVLLTLTACGDAVANPIRIAQSSAEAGVDADVGRDGSSAEPGRPGQGPNVPDTPHCADAAEWPVELAEAEYGLFLAINELRDGRVRCGDRESRDLPPFAFEPALRCSARLHSKDM